MAEVVGGLILYAAGYAELATIPLLGGAITVGGAVGGAALIGGSALLGALAMPSRVDTAAPKPGDGSVALRQQIPPRLVGYGRARIAGAYMFYEVNVDGDSDDVLALHHGKVSFAGARYYLNEDEVGLTGNGYVANAVDVHGTFLGGDNRYGIGLGNYVNITLLPGDTPSSTHGAFVSANPGVWTSAHRGDGQAAALMRCAHVPIDDHWKVYPRGLPKLSVVCDLTAIYDPRSGSQSRGDPTTWTRATNPVLQIIDYLTSSHHGLGLDWDDVIAPNLTALMAQANICDELVAKVGGTEARYKSNGWFYMTTDPADVLAEMLATCDGWLTESGNGAIALVVGKYQAPTVTFTDDHIVGFTIDHGVADEETVNQLKFSYTEPLNAYRTHPGAPWQDDTAIAESGVIRAQSRTFGWVQSHSQARRLSKRLMARYQARLRGTLVVNLYGLQALGQRWVAVQSDMISDLANAVIEISKAKVDILNARVTFDWVLVNPNAIDAWDPSTEEGTRPPIP